MDVIKTSLIVVGGKEILQVPLQYLPHCSLIISDIKIISNLQWYTTHVYTNSNTNSNTVYMF